MDVGAVGAAIGGAAGAVGGAAVSGAAGAVGGAGLTSAATGAQTAGASEIGGAQIGGTDPVSTSAATPTGMANSAALSGAVTPQLQNLVQSLKDFSSAEILIALMLMRAAESDPSKKHPGGDAALGMLAGLAFASQFAHLGAGLAHSQSVPDISGGGLAGSAGFQINVQV